MPADDSESDSGDDSGDDSGFDFGSIFNGGSGGNSDPAPTMSDGMCCDDGNCICREPPPSRLNNRAGPYRVATERARTGTLYYPSNADPPFAGVAIVPGFLNTGPEMRPWGQFYASHGIVTMVTSTGAADQPPTRARKLLAAVDEMMSLAEQSGGAIGGKMAGWYGTSGYSMGGGGTTIAASDRSSLKTSVGLAAYGPAGARSTQVPTLLICGSTDAVAGCNFARSHVDQIPDSVPKGFVTIPLTGHLAWFNTGAGGGLAGAVALGWQKVFLEGDERWRSALISTFPSGSGNTHNLR